MIEKPPLDARAWLLPELEESSHPKVKYPSFNAAQAIKVSNAQIATFANSAYQLLNTALDRCDAV
ncbi:hypothetical protein [Shimia sagamensis]|uniref:hypothetical protein n=1 Tax=Shimia sagamensis TaxID=1566352 RepID=UPI0024B6A1EB|nr:hypothetical protein [Shimia sagamensis]